MEGHVVGDKLVLKPFSKRQTVCTQPVLKTAMHFSHVSKLGGPEISTVCKPPSGMICMPESLSFLRSL